MEIPDDLICLLRNLFVGQEAAIRTLHRTTNQFKIGKGVWEGCISSPCLFNFFAEYIMQNGRLDESQAGIKIAGRRVSNLRYADDTTLMAESEAELKSLLMKVEEENEKAGLKFSIQKTNIMASHPIISWQIEGEKVEAVTDVIFLGSKITVDSDYSLASWKGMTNLDQSILKEVNSEYSFEGLMLMLKLQYFGQLKWRTDLLKKTLMLGKIEGKRRGWQRMRCYHWLNGCESEQTPGDSEGQGSLMCCSPLGHKELDTTWQLSTTTTKCIHIYTLHVPLYHIFKSCVHTCFHTWRFFLNSPFPCF